MDWSKIPSITQIDVTEKRVFLRLDLNVPIKQGQIKDDTRIRAALPTINYLLARSAKLILASHLGRPKGEVKAELSLEPIAKKLAELLKKEVILSDYPIGDAARKLVQDLRGGDVLLLENLRFDLGETKNAESFAQELASYADVYINDAFGVVHRAEASTTGILPFVKGPCGVGFLMKKEIEALSRLKSSPEKPFVAILGGAKVSDKIGLIQSLLEQCESVLIGGAMAYTFLKAQGVEVAKSLVEDEHLTLARSILLKAEHRSVQLLLPLDHVVAAEIKSDSPTEIVEGDFPSGKMGLDIGPKTRHAFSEIIQKAGKIFWNGPMGVFETTPFNEGTFAIAKALTETKAFTLVGGGDSAAAVQQSGYSDKIGHISTGGGASLEFLEQGDLPGLAALRLVNQKN